MRLYVGRCTHLCYVVRLSADEAPVWQGEPRRVVVWRPRLGRDTTGCNVGSWGTTLWCLRFGPDRPNPEPSILGFFNRRGAAGSGGGYWPSLPPPNLLRNHPNWWISPGSCSPTLLQGIPPQSPLILSENFKKCLNFCYFRETLVHQKSKNLNPKPIL
jgi:hypothetical protein